MSNAVYVRLADDLPTDRAVQAAAAALRIERERPCLDADTTDDELARWARVTVIPALEEAGLL